MNENKRETEEKKRKPIEGKMVRFRKSAIKATRSTAATLEKKREKKTTTENCINSFSQSPLQFSSKIISSLSFTAYYNK